MNKIMDNFGVFDYVETNDGTYEYTAEEMRSYFAGIIGDGILKGKGGEFEASTSGLLVTLQAGEAWLQGVHGTMTDAWAVNLDPVVSGMSCICSFVLDADITNQLMGISILVGSQAASPSAPALTQSLTRFQQLICLAQVHDDGTVTISDARTIIAKPGDVITPENIGAAKRLKMLTATLYAANWSNGNYNLAVLDVTGPLTYVELLPAVGVTLEVLSIIQAANIVDGGQSAGVCTLTARGTVPTTNIAIRILVGGDVIQG